MLLDLRESSHGTTRLGKRLIDRVGHVALERQGHIHIDSDRLSKLINIHDSDRGGEKESLATAVVLPPLLPVLLLPVDVVAQLYRPA